MSTYFSDEDIKKSISWLENQGKEIDIEIRDIRKLKTTWTVEMAQDLNAYLGIDVEEELMELLKTKSVI